VGFFFFSLGLVFFPQYSKMVAKPCALAWLRFVLQVILGLGTLLGWAEPGKETLYLPVRVQATVAGGAPEWQVAMWSQAELPWDGRGRDSDLCHSLLDFEHPAQGGTYFGGSRGWRKTKKISE
jgi:hypothetical protein